MIYPANDREGDDVEALDAEEQLLLDEGDDVLPWLEDDGDYSEEGAFDARLIWFALLGLVVIGAVLFGAWYFTNQTSDPEQIADGSTIEAPDGPYKQRPDDPGGREVEGTGDTAYQVAEGQSQRGRLADAGDDAPQPSIDIAQEGSASSSAPSGAAYVQIGAYTSRGDANAAWLSASNRYADALSGMNHRVVEAEVNGATVYRLQAVASSKAAGEAACRAIRDAGGDCYIR